MQKNSAIKAGYIPGSNLLNLWILGAMIVLVLNDHIFKSTYGNTLTGKLSDFAGLLFFPILLHAILEILLTASFNGSRRSNQLLTACVLATGIVFTAIQVSLPWAEGYQHSLGFIRWALALGFIDNSPMLIAQHWADPTDLIALPMLLGSLQIGWRRS